MLLEVYNLRTHYGKVEAVKGVSFTIDEGEIVALIGSNGAGKTTILRTISGLTHPTSGQIMFLDKRIDMLSPAAIVRLGIAHVPEGRKLFPHLTVLENLRLGAFVRKIDKQELNRNLEEVYEHFPLLRERTKQQAGSLSGGEQQMLAMGRGLMSRPKLLLLDEPSLGLAPRLVEEIATIIMDIQKRGLSIILVEQNAFLALRLADRGYVLETGRMALEGSGDELLGNEHVKKAYLGG